MGGSEIAAVLGESKFSSPLLLWMEKKGQASQTEITEQQRNGSRMEATILAFTLEDMASIDPAIKIIPFNYMLEHSRDGFPAKGNLDGLVNLFGEWGGFEAKNVIEYAGKEWVDDLPTYYYYQVQWYIYVTGLPWFLISAYVGGRHLVVKKITRHEQTIQKMVAAAKHFWTYNILQNQLPPITSSLDSCAIRWDIQMREKYTEVLDLEDHYTLKGWVDRHVELQQLGEDTRERQTVLGLKIKQAMLALKARCVTSEGCVVKKLSFRKGAKKLNKKLLIERYPDVQVKMEECTVTGDATVILL